jgi:hypothetical protein
MYYAPLHLLTVAHILESLSLELAAGTTIVDLGCGTGAAGAAWAMAAEDRATVMGFDRHPWAIREAEWTWRTLGVHGRAVRGDLARARWPKGRRALIAAFTVNELADDARARLWERVLHSVEQGDAVLVVEPLARAVAPWWEDWARGLSGVGGEQRTWRARVALPEIVTRFDRATGLDHRELMARSIHVGQRPRPN